MKRCSAVTTDDQPPPDRSDGPNPHGGGDAEQTVDEKIIESTIAELQKKCGDFLKQLFDAAESYTGLKPVSTSMVELFKMVTSGTGGVTVENTNLSGSLKVGTASFGIGPLGAPDPKVTDQQFYNGVAQLSMHQLFHLAGYGDEHLSQAMF